MSAQTSYDRNSEIAFAGMKTDAGFDRVESYLAEGAIPFGNGVVKGTDLDQVKNAAAPGDIFRGFAVHKHKEPSAVGANDAEYVDEEAVSVLTQGVIWVEYETTLAVPVVDDDAYVNVDVGGAELGRVTGVVGTNLPTGGKIKQVDTSTGLAAVQINLP